MLYKTRIYIKNTLRCMLRMYGAFIIHAHLDLHICNSNEPSLNNFIDCVVVSVYRASPQSPRAKLTSFYDGKMFKGNILRHLKEEKKKYCSENALYCPYCDSTMAKTKLNEIHLLYAACVL